MFDEDAEDGVANEPINPQQNAFRAWRWGGESTQPADDGG